MLSEVGFGKLNSFLTSVLKFGYLNILWVLVTAIGLVFLGIGPATYALAKYIDRWLRFHEEPPVAATFLQYVREVPIRSIIISWIYGGVLAVIIFNLLSSVNTAVRIANMVLGVIVLISLLYIYPVMAATTLERIRELIPASVLVGLGSLHFTALVIAVSTGVVYVLWNYALPLLVIFGVGIPAALVGLVTRSVFNDLIAD